MTRKSEVQIEKEFNSEYERQQAEPKVKIFIPKDPLNPANAVWVSVNGVGRYLAVGKQIEVPASVAEAWQYSYAATQEAYARMSENVEIG